MKKLITALCLAFLLGAALPVVLTGGQKVSAQEQEEEQQSSENEQQSQGASYRYVAQPGDSYTLMARKAVQTYGLKHDVSLSQAQIIFAETRMAQEAGSPQLEVGQNVEVAESVIKQWVDRTQELSEEDESDWNYYAQFANFNTDNVGESR